MNVSGGHRSIQHDDRQTGPAQRLKLVFRSDPRDDGPGNLSVTNHPITDQLADRGAAVGADVDAEAA